MENKMKLILENYDKIMWILVFIAFTVAYVIESTKPQTISRKSKEADWIEINKTDTTYYYKIK